MHQRRAGTTWLARQVPVVCAPRPSGSQLHSLNGACVCACLVLGCTPQVQPRSPGGTSAGPTSPSSHRYSGYVASPPRQQPQQQAQPQPQPWPAWQQQSPPPQQQQQQQYGQGQYYPQQQGMRPGPGSVSSMSAVSSAARFSPGGSPGAGQAAAGSGGGAVYGSPGSGPYGGGAVAGGPGGSYGYNVQQQAQQQPGGPGWAGGARVAGRTTPFGIMQVGRCGGWALGGLLVEEGWRVQ